MLDTFEKLFKVLAEFLVARRKKVLLAGLLLGLACLPICVYTLRHLDANLLNQVSERLPRFKALKEVTTDFGGDILVGVITASKDAGAAKNIADLKAFGDTLATELSTVGLSAEDQQALKYRLGDKALDNPVKPWLLQVECRLGAGARAELRSLVQAQPHLFLRMQELAEIEHRFDPEYLKTRMHSLREELSDMVGNSLEREQLMRDPLDLHGLMQASIHDALQAQGQTLTSGDDDYFLSSDHTMLLVLARPTRSSNNVAFNKVLLDACQRAENRAIAAFRAKVPDSQLTLSLKAPAFGQFAVGERDPSVRVGFTGLHALSVENEQSLRKDILGGTIVAFLALLVVFFFAYRSLGLTLHVTLTLVLAAVVTLAVAGIVRGGVGVLGAGFTCILIGTGVDYGIMVYGTYRKLRLETGLDAHDAVIQTLMRRGPGIFMACITTVVGFVGLGVVDFQAVAEFGVLTGIGLFVSSILMFIFFPMLLAGSKAPPDKAATPLGLKTLGRFLSTPAGRATGLGLGVISAALCIGLVIWQPPLDAGMEKFLAVRFDPDLGNLRNRTAPASVLRDQVAEKFRSGFADLRVIVDASDEATALNALTEVQSRAQHYLQSGELKPGGSLAQYVPNIGAQNDVLEKLKIFDVQKKEAAFLGAAQVEFGDKVKTAFAPFMSSLDEFAATANGAHRVSITECLDSSAGKFLAPFARVDKSPSGNRVRLVSYFFPKVLQYSEEWLQGFADSMEQSPPAGCQIRVTAGRFVGFELKRSVIHDMEWIFCVVAVIITVMVLYPLHSVRLAVLAMIPLAFSYLFVLGGIAFATRMGWELSLNYINLMIFPILLGSAVDYGIYMVFDHYSGLFPTIGSVIEETGHSLILCCATTLGGYGSMIVGTNSGLTSFGWTAILGYLGALFAAVIVLPVLFQFSPKTK
jgi:predicted RND superfamily exporter protein